VKNHARTKKTKCQNHSKNTETGQKNEMNQSIQRKNYVFPLYPDQVFFDCSAVSTPAPHLTKASRRPESATAPTRSSAA
jgi:hypothetical protein